MLFLVGGPIGAVLLNISGVFAADSESENSENRSPIGAPGALRRWIWARGFGGERPRNAHPEWGGRDLKKY